LNKFFRILEKTISRFLKDSCIIKAQALSFITVLSFVPLFSLFLSIYSVSPFFLSFREKAREFILSNILPPAAMQAESFIYSIARNAKGLGILGVGGLFLAVVLFLGTIEKFINEIWRIRKTRPFIRKITTFWSFMTLFPLTVVLSIYIGSFLSRSLGAFSLRLFSVFLSFVGFFSIYFFLPFTKVRMKVATYTGIIATILWEVSKLGFEIYLKKFSFIGKLYGSLSVIPVTLIWLYLFWLIILFGTELSYTLQKGDQNGDHSSS